MPAIVVAFAAALGAGYLSPLSLHLSAAPRSINVGEPVRLRVAWSVSEPLHVGSTVDILLARGHAGSFVPWIETVIGVAFDGEMDRHLVPGAIRITNHDISVTGRRDTAGAGHFEFAFPEPGLYRVKVRHRRGPDAVTSNEVEITARAPQGADRDLFERYLRHQPHLLTRWLVLSDPKLMAALFERYPNSAYLGRPRIIWYENLITEAMARAPETERLSDPVGGEVPSLLERLRADSLGDSPFEEDRLVALAEMAERASHFGIAMDAWRELAARYPDSPGGERGRERLEAAAARQSSRSPRR